MLITNKSDIPLSLAVWLMHDEYDYINEPNYISVTRLMRPLRHIILPPRVEQSDAVADLEDYISRAMGHAFHDSIEKAWIKGYAKSLRKLGYPQDVIDRILVNPTFEELDAKPNAIPIYLEQRAIREFEGRKIGGKYDLLTDGIVTDNKSTSAWGWVFGTRDEEHQLQASLYRWIDAGQPRQKITEDYMQVNYIFTDWQKAQARSNPKYPQSKLAKKEIPLLSLQETEDWIRSKLAQIDRYKDKPESELPLCTDEELWRSEPSYRYFTDPAKANQPGARSTKNFDNLNDARKFQAEKGGVGAIVTKEGEVKRCGFCDAFPICTQKNQYFSGE